METVVERPGVLDVHKAQVTACVRVPAEHGSGREQHVVEFSTTVAGLLTLREWLTAHGVVVPARRGRVVEVEFRAAEADPCASEPHEVSQDPDPGALREALEGRFDRLHAVWIGAILAHLDFLDEQIAGLTETIGEQIAPFEKAVELLCTIPGVQRRTAEVIIAEIGVDMSIFPTAKELASWAGQCPGNDRSAGRRRSERTSKGSKWLDWALEEAALAATRTNDVYLQAQYQRLRPRRGHKKALGAVKHSIVCACWHMLSTGELYNDLGGDYFRKRDPQRTTKRLVAQLEALGHNVTLQEAVAA
jgi:Transposase IS116/IS110/IS902 family